MFSNKVNLNYFLGFVIVILIFVTIVVWFQTPEVDKPREKKNCAPLPKRRWTLITIGGYLNVTQETLDNYLTRLNANLEYVIKKIDTDNCDDIADRVWDANQKFAKQISLALESRDLSPEQLATINSARNQVKTRLNSVSQALFENDQNEDVANIVDILYEMVQDLESLTYLIRMNSTDDSHTIDISDVDRVVQLIYRTACRKPLNKIPPSPKPHMPLEAPDRIVDWKGVITDINDIDMDPASPTFGTFIDRYRYQNVVAETDAFANPWNSPETAPKLQKKSLVKVRTSVLPTQVQKDKHAPLSVRQANASPQDAPGLSASVRIKTAQENFVLERPNRYKKYKNSLNDAYKDGDMVGRL